MPTPLSRLSLRNRKLQPNTKISIFARRSPLLLVVLYQLMLASAAFAQGIITTVAGAGWSFRGDGGRAADAQLATVEGMALDASGNLYAADSENHVIVRITPG